MLGADGPPIRVTSSGSGWNGWAWAWSPTTEQLAFVTERSGLAELVLLDPATGERISVTTDVEIATPSWSPDGTGSRSRRVTQASTSSMSQPGKPPRSTRMEPSTRTCRGRRMGCGSSTMTMTSPAIGNGSSSSTRMDRTAVSSSRKAIHTARGLRAGRRTARRSPTCGHPRSRVPLATSRSRSG